MTDRSDDALADAVDNAWLAQIAASWFRYNVDLLNGALRQPAFVLLNSDATLGQWNSTQRTIGIAREHIARSTWGAVLETLRHEMAHQFVDETMPGAADESDHGPGFRIACAKLRVDHAATGSVQSRSQGDDDTHGERVRVLRRLEKLLSLSASPNENEATAAFRMARRLMLEHEVDLASIRPDDDAAPPFAVRDLGPVKARHQAWEFVLANILDEFFFVDILWAQSFDAMRCKAGTVVRAYGSPHHLDFAEHVHTFLTDILDSLWDDYRRRNDIRGNRDRQRYFHGLLLGFKKTLSAQDAEIARDEPGLVIANENAALRAFFHHHNPQVRTVTRGRARSSRALEDGQQDGRSIRIHRPIADQGGGFGGLLE